MSIFQKPLVLLLFHVLFISVFLQNVASSPRTEAEALVKWKNTLLPSASLDSWSLSNLKNLCNWTGITCNAAGTVSELSISGQELNGTLAHFNFSSFPNLTSLDMSSNLLGDGIPVAIGNLRQLEYLSFDDNYLTENNLSGEIPRGMQFNTFSNESFHGNLALCGVPLTKKCRYDKSPIREVDDDDDDDDNGYWFKWNMILMGYGCGLICGLSTGYIVFTNSKPIRFVIFIERAQQKLIRRYMKNSRVLNNIQRF